MRWLFCLAAWPLAAATVDDIFATWNRTNSPGCAAGVMENGSLTFARGYGMADLDHDIAISPRSVFHVASLSKQFTAMSIVLLAADGKLTLDDPVRKHLPELRDFGKPLTIRHLLHHTSGLRDQWSMLSLAGWRLSEDVVRDEDVMELVGRMRELNFEPGEQYLYSNTGYTLLAQIVRRVSGRSLREFTRERIFEPLGMHDTHFRDDHQETVKGMAYGYAPYRGGFRQSIPHYDTTGASSLLTTVEDWAKWDAAFDRFGARLLVAARRNDGGEIAYRFGLTEGVWRGTRVIEHSGADAGYRAHYLRLAEHKLSVIALCNTVADPSALTRRVAERWLAGKLPAAPDQPKPAPVVLSDAQLRPLAGLYWSDTEPGARRVEIDGARLVIRAGSGRTLLTPVAADRFAGDVPGIEFQFAGGRLFEKQPDRTVEFRMVEVARVKPGDYAGSYRSDELDAVFLIETAGDSLILRRKKLTSYPLEGAVSDAFVAPGLGVLRFARDAAGRVNSFRLSTGRVQGLLFVRVQ